MAKIKYSVADATPATPPMPSLKIKEKIRKTKKQHFVICSAFCRVHKTKSDSSFDKGHY